MYRKVRDNTVADLAVRDGKLSMGRTVLTLTGPGVFSVGERQFIFESDKLREVTPDGDILYERVEPAHPSDAGLKELAGDYESRDTRSTLKVAADSTGLTLAIGWNAPLRLRPTFRDAFMMEGRGGAASIRFLRDSAGKITGLSAGDDRAWDIRFTRMSASR